MKRLLILLLLSPLLSYTQERKKLPRLIPDHIKIQFAGAIGLLSVGTGYESPNKKFQGDFYYGYVPKKYGGDKPIHSITGKFTYLPLHTTIGDDIDWSILTAGILFNYTFGKQYFMFKPDNYPYQYYGFPTGLNGSIFIGTAVQKRRVGIYYELGANGKDILSYVKNTNSLSFFDLLHMGIGTRIAIK